MIYRFLRLSMVRIFPRATLQAKNVVLMGHYAPNTLPRDRGDLMRYKDIIERSNTKNPFLGRHTR
jgi:hypothetical protein